MISKIMRNWNRNEYSSCARRRTNGKKKQKFLEKQILRTRQNHAKIDTRGTISHAYIFYREQAAIGLPVFFYIDSGDMQTKPTRRRFRAPAGEPLNLYKKGYKKGATIMAMTRKCFAAIMTAKENSEKIKKLTDSVLSGSVTKAYGAIKEIAALNEKYIQDFGSVNPYWTPDGNGKPETKKAPAPVPLQKLSPEVYAETTIG